MAYVRKIQGSDTFTDLAGTFLSDHLATDGSGSVWNNCCEIVSGRLVIPTSGRVQCSTTNAASSAASLQPNFVEFIGLDLTKPRYCMTVTGRGSLGAVMERMLAGIYSPVTNTFFGGGYFSNQTALEGTGDNATVIFAPALVKSVHGGGWLRFPLQNPFAAQDVLAGGLGMRQSRFEAGAFDWIVCLYIDEYQMTMVFRYPENGVDATFSSTYFAYPPELRILRPPLSAASDTPQYEPALLMRQSDITASGGRISDLFYEFFDFTPQNTLPSWEPVEGMFVAKVDLNFQSGEQVVGPFGLAVPASEGPYLVFPPSSYRDVEITAQMLMIDNGSNPAYLDMSIGSLSYEISPYTRFQLILPTFSTPIKVSGGGNRAKLYLYSEAISHVFN